MNAPACRQQLVQGQNRRQSCPGTHSAPTARAGELKTIYLAPARALVQEKCLDWQQRFGALGVTCAEITGKPLGRAGFWPGGVHARMPGAFDLRVLGLTTGPPACRGH